MFVLGKCFYNLNKKMFQKAGRDSREFTADDVKIDVKQDADDGGHHGEF